MKIMYLDESGDHSLKKVDPAYPIFVLGGVIVDGVVNRRKIDRKFEYLKEEFFGRSDLVLHTADIVRARNGFESLRNPNERLEFYEALNEILREVDFQVVACAIKKEDHFAQYGADAIDPYMLSLFVLVERFWHEIGDTPDGGLICAEKRDPELDHALETAWIKISRSGTFYRRGSSVSNRIVDLVLKDKRLNIGGLQLADLVISPIGRAVLGKQTHEDWEIVKSKLRRGPRGFEGYGLVTLPRPNQKREA